MSKISDKYQSRDMVQNIYRVLLKTAKIIQNKEMLKLRGTQGDITTKCQAGFLAKILEWVKPIEI